MQPPIEDHAFLGDGRTSALVTSDGRLDWMCLPGFDGEPIFSSLVDERRNASFDITIENATLGSRSYREGSVVTETVWHTTAGRAVLTEGFVTEVSRRLLPDNLLVRRIDAEGSACTVRIRFDPRRGLPGKGPVVATRAGATVCSWGTIAVTLTSAPYLGIRPGSIVETTVEPGRPLTLALSHVHRGPAVLVDAHYASSLLEETDRRWREWASDISYDGPFNESVRRSLITLRLLTFSASGAPVAAPTTSLPEVIGGGRNWDYRYSWPRDASIGVAAFLAAGKNDEARSFVRWLFHATRLSRPRLGVLYSAYGKPLAPEREIPDVSGYRDSLPVRTGNDALGQHQLDVYGWVLDAAALLDRDDEPHDRATWSVLQSFADFIAKNWQTPDAGIWEVRDDERHYVHSKLMAWLGLDRTIRSAARHRTSRRRLERWVAARDALAADIRKNGYDDRRGYVRSYGADEMDASLLLLPVIGFDESSDRVRKTVASVRQQLAAGRSLVYRYKPGIDGMSGREGAFLPACFWLAQALAYIGEIDEAGAVFDDLVSLANPFGLFAEEVDPNTRAHLGNFPQAFTHSALVQAALALERFSAA